jgi:DNA-binding CsgD family transcriptional regulator
MARYHIASEYLREALSYEIHSKLFEVSFASIGIPLALYVNDDEMLNACARESSITSVFQSGEPPRIAQIATAFAQLYALRGEQHKAQTLLHNALDHILHADLSWDVLLEIAKQGKRADVPRARKVLAKRAALPSASVTQAYLSLFDAFIAQRERRTADMHVRASEAAGQFEAIHWYAYAEMAHTLLPTRKTSRTTYDIAPFAQVQTLTSRERQIAELVLKGLTNREVADRLSIGERTVESHMTSIMARLGIRSRHQLDGTLLGSGA